VDAAAFDNEPEYQACAAAREEIERRRGDGGPVDPREHVSGVVQEPGCRRRAANGRLVWRAIAHGVAPGRLDGLDLPGNVSFVRAEREDQGMSHRSSSLLRGHRTGASLRP
jgi:hypothetical protein